jgi:hypothetical protein
MLESNSQKTQHYSEDNPTETPLLDPKKVLAMSTAKREITEFEMQAEKYANAKAGINIRFICFSPKIDIQAVVFTGVFQVFRILCNSVIQKASNFA